MVPEVLYHHILRPDCADLVVIYYEVVNQASEVGSVPGSCPAVAARAAGMGIAGR
ncbi:MAG TPA: hypothetical protein VN969_23775 [Streptosporangiaceae bacterium]|nr:hypothetical protein [Streptosporangiaceae bacterium]